MNTLWGQLLEHIPSEVEMSAAEGWRGPKAGEVGVSKQIYHGQKHTGEHESWKGPGTHHSPKCKEGVDDRVTGQQHH